MTSNPDSGETRPAWFVGASFGGVNDQTKRFIEEGIWENGNPNRYLNLVGSIQPGGQDSDKGYLHTQEQERTPV